MNANTQHTTFLNRFTPEDTVLLNEKLEHGWKVVQGYEQHVASSSHPSTGVSASSAVFAVRGHVLLVLEREVERAS